MILVPINYRLIILLDSSSPMHAEIFFHILWYCAPQSLVLHGKKTVFIMTKLVSCRQSCHGWYKMTVSFTQLWLQSVACTAQFNSLERSINIHTIPRITPGSGGLFWGASCNMSHLLVSISQCGQRWSVRLRRIIRTGLADVSAYLPLESLGPKDQVLTQDCPMNCRACRMTCHPG